MKKRMLHLSLALFVMLTSCSKTTADIAGASEVALSSPSNSGGSSNSGTQSQPGVITAGEWNDLEHWNFWTTVISKDEFKSMPAHWAFFNNNRISVHVSGTDAKPVVNAIVKLKKEGTAVFSARTDNKGNAELWADLFRNGGSVDYAKLTIDINNGSGIITKVKPYKDGVNSIVVAPATSSDNIQLAFVVDATGSMGDELEYLKTELTDVISRVKVENGNAAVSTSAVFYRDKGDEYITKVSNFTNNNSATINFIKGQKANGGGDFPEAVHSALDKAVNELQWAANAKTRILFLVLDAPPHHEDAVIKNIQTATQAANEKGIKIIPITASGIDKETEFLMRFLATSTNGTYVFITNHSGIGANHLEASVGPYKVEFLNNLMVRLINKYAQ